MAEKFYLITEDEKKLLLSALHNAYYMVSDDIACGIDEDKNEELRREYEKLETKLGKMIPRTV